MDDSQRASIINIYELIWAEEFPATHMLLKYVANLTVEDYKKNTINFSLAIKNSKNDILFKLQSPPTKIKKSEKIQNVGLIFNVQLITFPEPGKYTATLTQDKTTVAEHTVELKIQTDTTK